MIQQLGVVGQTMSPLISLVHRWHDGRLLRHYGQTNLVRWLGAWLFKFELGGQGAQITPTISLNQLSQRLFFCDHFKRSERVQLVVLVRAFQLFCYLHGYLLRKHGQVWNLHLSRLCQA